MVNINVIAKGEMRQFGTEAYARRSWSSTTDKARERLHYVLLTSAHGCT